MDWKCPPAMMLQDIEALSEMPISRDKAERYLSVYATDIMGRHVGITTFMI